MQDSKQKLAGLIWLWLAYTTFVVYGSLVPLDFHSLPFEQALKSFRHIPYLNLGVASRADWVANGVLYFPLGWLSATVLIYRLKRDWVIPALVLSASLCCALAVAVEFTQLYFPPRTVSLNDLIAETIGSVLGTLAAPVFMPWLKNFQQRLVRGGLELNAYLLEIIAVGYILLCFFPYDFLLSAAEITDKINSQSWGWWLAGNSGRSSLVFLQFAMEVFLCLPYGLILARKNKSIVSTALWGLLLGLVIEAIQFMIETGISQGLSVLSRSLGCVCGFMLWQLRSKLGVTQIVTHLKPFRWLFFILYCAALGFVNGWLFYPWHGWHGVLQVWPEVRLMPFYYHYYTTEAKAVYSLGVVALMYLPVSAFGWLSNWSVKRSALLATALCLIIEVSKLFLSGTHTDPTNLLIAFVSCAVFRKIMMLSSMAEPVKTVAVVSEHNTGFSQHANPVNRTNVASQTESMMQPDTHLEHRMPSPSETGNSAGGAAEKLTATQTNVSTVSNQSTGFRRSIILVAGLGLALLGLIFFPVFQVFLGILLLLSAAAVYWRPVLALAIIPAALVTLDFAPWSGRFYFDELDFLMLVCVSIGIYRADSVSVRGVSGSKKRRRRSSGSASVAKPDTMPETIPETDFETNFETNSDTRSIAESALGSVSKATAVISEELQDVVLHDADAQATLTDQTTQTLHNKNQSEHTDSRKEGQRRRRSSQKNRQSLHHKKPKLKLSLLLFILLGLSLCISMLIALLPWQLPDANSFISYYSPYNALRIIKGAFWAGAFVYLYRRLARHSPERMFSIGLQTGLAITVGFILWERLAFVGLFDFISSYRVTGPISAMHKGGAYIECFLALASAFTIVSLLQAKDWLRRLLPAVLLLLTVYALMVTFSRNGYAAFALILLMTGVISVWAKPEKKWLALIVIILSAGAAIPIVAGQYASERLSQSGNDLSIRQAHWKDALDMRSEGWQTEVFGMGLGRFPASHYWTSAEAVHAGSYQLGLEKENSFLSLGGGAALYMEQIVDLEKGKNYIFSARLRPHSATATMVVSLCQKWMLTSNRCATTTLAASAANQWQRIQVPLDAAELTLNSRLPIKLALTTPAAKQLIDVDDVQMESWPSGNVLSNGDFSKGLDHWFFTTDVDPPWHIHSLPVSILFDQGWLGVVSWAAILSLALYRGVRQAVRGSAIALASSCALAGFLVSGSLNTLIDAPRFLFLLLVLIWLAYSGSAEEEHNSQQVNV